MLGKLNVLMLGVIAPKGLLALNHMLMSEPAAKGRLQGHVGKVFELQVHGVAQWAGPLPTMRLRVTPAGLLETVHGDEGAASMPVDLVLTVQAAAPWEVVGAALQGRAPEVTVAGDSALATDLNWLAKNLRWDVADDLQRLVGPGPAQAASQFVHGAADLLRSFMKAMPGPKP